MVLVDTSVWIDHLRRGVPLLGDLLASALLSQTGLWTRDRSLHSLVKTLGIPERA